MKNSERLIQAIKERRIAPVPKAFFTGRELLLWLVFALSALLGAAAFSVILFSIQQTDFYLLQHSGHSRLELLLSWLPFVWMAFLFVFLGLSMFSFRNSRRGYKWRLTHLAAYSFGFSVLLGTAFFLAGGAARLERAFDVRVSIYQSMEEKKIKVWSMPEQGYLSGVIETVDGEEMTIRDFDGKIWAIDISNAFVAPVLALDAGEQVKLTGRMTSEGRFEADGVRPWGGPGFRHQKK
ncbi:MAG: hypothetical protein IAE84_20155 [Saprospiraceae bacterium]|jgi:hypothetical protein|nr:hypothetical protein [Saprospiraceae bacterium]HRD83010.1 hypothetical protein [Saprospiraceae bacterium]HRF37373.1 hypothetical protein [Saprospiraceae bacterium]HRK80321.1 hypothetical protein [Saprospiraceae bacterium]